MENVNNLLITIKAGDHYTLVLWTKKGVDEELMMAINGSFKWMENFKNK